MCITFRVFLGLLSPAAILNILSGARDKLLLTAVSEKLTFLNIEELKRLELLNLSEEFTGQNKARDKECVFEFINHKNNNLRRFITSYLHFFSVK